MEIKKIELVNVGPYYGKNTFETNINDDKNIILIGGKNGAGKTTLFTAIKICLYGSMAYKTKIKNAKYFKKIVELINNRSKNDKNSIAKITLDIAVPRGAIEEEYKISRSWKNNDGLHENFEVWRNGLLLEEESKADFEKYLFEIIPQELFDLYFFDGDDIADFFLKNEGVSAIRSFILKVCRYDNFELLENNFKRLTLDTSNENKTHVAEYMSKRDELSEIDAEIDSLKTDLETIETKEKDLEQGIAKLDADYKNKGGISEDEQISLLADIKAEEHKREELNYEIKKLANDTIPFLMLKELLNKLKQQINNEEANNMYFDFLKIIESEKINSLLNKYENLSDEIKSAAKDDFYKNEDNYLNLSNDERDAIKREISRILEYKNEDIFTKKRIIKSSINKSAKIRDQLEKTSSGSFKEYITKRNELIKEKSDNSLLFSETVEKLENRKVDRISVDKDCNKLKEIAEKEIKGESIADISSRAYLMVEELKKELIRKQRGLIEIEIIKKINELMRKEKFVDKILLDENLNIRLYKNEEYTIKEFKDKISQLPEETITLIEKDHQKTIAELITDMDIEKIWVPIEKKVNQLSNGEKQIFILSLYSSVMNIADVKLPFLIDTPFARIDKDNRSNIANSFLKDLRGQVIIFSTDEEVIGSLKNTIDSQIKKTYLLENTDNICTKVIEDAYFEV